MKPSQENYTPSHPGLFAVEFKPGDFSSACVASKDFKEGELITFLDGLTKGPKAYTTVQCGPGPEDHIELNSDLVYVNHSCEPNVAFDLMSPNQSKWHVRALKPIRAGEPLTFFYPSTEWHMDQPFNCFCGTPSCLGKVQGADSLSLAQLEARGFVSPWIVQAIEKRDASSCKSCGVGYTAGSSLCGCRPQGV